MYGQSINFICKQFQTKNLIDLKDPAIGQKIYKEQYPLNDQKRLVVTHHTLNNIKTGLLKPMNIQYTMCQ